ncbi:MAG: polyamine ABC transporter substrate-binding protein [Succinivibrionaceae bacterium]
MKKSILSLVMSGIVALSMNQAVSAEEQRVLHVYNWNESIDPAIVPAFEKVTGIKVVYDLFDSNEVLEAKLLAGKSGYDVVFPGSEFVTHQARAGVYHELPYDKIPNLKNLNKVQMEQLKEIDPGNKHAIPYLSGTTGIAYDKNKVAKYLGEDFVIDSWDVFFKPEILSKLKPCGVAVLNAPTEVMATAMHYLGLNPNSDDPKEYRKAEKLLTDMAKNVTYFHSSQSINDLANGEICITLAWSGDMMQARERALEANNGVDIQYIVPKEGALIFYDMMAIPADAPNKEDAYKFIDFIMDPHNMAQIESYTSYASANKESRQYVDPKVTSNPHLFIPEEKMSKMFLLKGKSQKVLREVTKIWSRVKSTK